MEINQFQLTFCSNILTGESWNDHFTALREYFPPVKKVFNSSGSLSVGLRVSNLASHELITAACITEFRSWLALNNSYVFTLNGFPYGEFHNVSVKDQVHFPDWTNPDRLYYTLRLIDILAALLPVGLDGGISTSPLSYKYWFDSDIARHKARAEATQNILRVAERLIALKIETGQLIHLDIEPEPDGLIETGTAFIDWFLYELIPAAKKYPGSKFGFDELSIENTIRQHICLCYDICHFAIGFEDHAAMISELARHKIRVGKLQISAALKADFTGDFGSDFGGAVNALALPAANAQAAHAGNAQAAHAGNAQAAHAANAQAAHAGNAQAVNSATRVIVAGYNEPVYLHQVVARDSRGQLTRYPDLNLALASQGHDQQQWRIHFHVPVFCEKLAENVFSTQADIIEVLGLLKNNPFTHHLEIETYTWEVLPAALKLPLEKSIIRELEWVKNQLISVPDE